MKLIFSGYSGNSLRHTPTITEKFQYAGKRISTILKDFKIEHNKKEGEENKINLTWQFVLVDGSVSILDFAAYTNYRALETNEPEIKTEEIIEAVKTAYKNTQNRFDTYRESEFPFLSPIPDISNEELEAAAADLRLFLEEERPRL